MQPKGARTANAETIDEVPGGVFFFPSADIDMQKGSLCVKNDMGWQFIVMLRKAGDAQGHKTVVVVIGFVIAIAKTAIAIACHESWDIPAEFSLLEKYWGLPFPHLPDISTPEKIRPFGGGGGLGPHL